MASQSPPDTITLFCWILGDKNGFFVEINRGQTINHLMKAIVKEASNRLQGIDAHQLDLYEKSIPTENKHSIKRQDLRDDELLDSADDIADHFNGGLQKKHIHVVVVPPPGK